MGWHLSPSLGSKCEQERMCHTCCSKCWFNLIITIPCCNFHPFLALLATGQEVVRAIETVADPRGGSMGQWTPVQACLCTKMPVQSHIQANHVYECLLTGPPFSKFLDMSLTKWVCSFFITPLSEVQRTLNYPQKQLYNACLNTLNWLSVIWRWLA